LTDGSGRKMLHQTLGGQEEAGESPAADERCSGAAFNLPDTSHHAHHNLAVSAQIPQRLKVLG